MNRKGTYLFAAAVGALAWLAALGSADDWPQWGGSNDRNMVSDQTDLPARFAPGRKRSSGGSGIDPATTENVRWTRRIGTFVYGNPSVAGGRVFVGTDLKTLAADQRFRYRKGGLVKCLDEQTGRLLWQLPIPERTHLPKGAHYGYQHLGVLSSPTVDGERVYVISPADEVLCLDVNGLKDGNDGAFRAEAQYLPGDGNPPVKLNPEIDGDILWRFDLIDELDVCPHDAASCSVLVCGDFVYTSTSNGMDEAHQKLIRPDAPSFIALNKYTGRLAASDDHEIAPGMFHCQWSSPSAGTVNGRTLILLGGGDGVCYAFEALCEMPAEPIRLKKLWSYDCNPPHYKRPNGTEIGYYVGDKRKGYSTNKNDGQFIGPSQIIATPVCYRGRVYVAIGQDPAHGRGKGMLHCIDAAQTGEITRTGCVWTYDGLDRSLATVAISDGLVYAGDIAGRLHCLDADTGRCYWVHETQAEAWGGPLVADGKVYYGSDKNFTILAAGKKKNVLFEIRMPDAMQSTPVVANGTIYLTSKRDLWAVSKQSGTPVAGK
ncbi:MAG: PQQ-binding-like beta-propeller repeat protein [Sedimentisphaerales bacterium]|nr:PQQ-binding-like beta-propeller repeat protein [Sedimentisphaerales bacterium]